MSEYTSTAFIELILHISKNIPRSLSLSFIILIIKYLPLVVITHDWNITSEHKSISYWLRKITLSQAFHKEPSKIIYLVIIWILFSLLIFSLFSLCYIYYQIKNQSWQFSHKRIAKILTWIIYFANHTLITYFYSIAIELLFLLNSGILFYIIWVISLFIALFSCLFSLFINLISNSPWFISNTSLITSNWKTIDCHNIWMSMCQIVIQWENHVGFERSLVFKNIARGWFVLLYWYNIYSYKNNCYYHIYWSITFKFCNSLCFISCLIEWVCYFDFVNGWVILQKDNSLIILKVIVEIIFALLIVEYYLSKEKKEILKVLTSFGTLSQKREANEIVSTKNVIKLWNLFYYNADIHLIKFFTNEIFKLLKNSIHLPRCISTKKCYFCHIFNSDKYEKEQDNYFYLIQSNSILQNESEFIKNNFETLFEFFTKMVNQNIKAIQKNRVNFTMKGMEIYFTGLLFYYTFDKNYFKCWYLIQIMKSNVFYKKSFIWQVQLNLLNSQILKDYKQLTKKYLNTSITDKKEIILQNSHKEIYTINTIFKSLTKLIKAENLIREVLHSYSAIAQKFVDEQNIVYATWSQVISEFKIKYERTMTYIDMLTTNYKCEVVFNKIKIYLFLSYFLDFSNKSNKQTIERLDNYFINLNKNNDNYLILIWKSTLKKNEIVFDIDYANDNLVKSLNYNTNDFSNLTLLDIFGKQFYKAYKYIIEDGIKRKCSYFELENFCLIDRNKYNWLFTIKSVIIFTHWDGVKILFKWKEGNIDRWKKIKNPKKKGEMKLKLWKKISRNWNMEKDINQHLNNYNIIIFTNKKGNITHMNREFELFFFINPVIWSKYRINIKNLWKTEHLGKEGSVVKNIDEIYNNIIELNSSEVGNIIENQFSLAVNDIKEMKRKMGIFARDIRVEFNYEQKTIQKGKKKNKCYYIFSIQVYNWMKFINSSNNVNINMDHILSNLEIFEILRQTKMENNSSSIIYSISQCEIDNTIFKKNSVLQGGDGITNQVIVENNNEVKKKWITIKTIAIRLLYYFYNFNFKNLSEDTSNKESFCNINQYSHLNKVNKDKSNYKLPKYRHIVHNRIWFFCCWAGLTMILIVVFVLKIKQINIEKDFIWMFNQFSLLKVLTTGLSQQVMYWQFQSNKWQNSLIDNNQFDNSIEHHKKQLNYKLIDFNTIFYNHVLPFFMKNTRINELYPILLQKVMNWTIVNRDGSKGEAQKTALDVQYINLLIRQVWNSGEIPLYYNQTVYFNYIGDETDYYAKYTYVYIIENFLTHYSFVFNELYNAFPSWVNTEQMKIQKNLSFIIFGNIVVLSIIIIIGVIIFQNNFNHLFEEYFLIYIQLRFFSIYLYKKTQNIITCFEDCTNSQWRNWNKVFLANDGEDVLMMKNYLSGSFENFKSIRIRPFRLKNANRKTCASRRSPYQSNEIISSLEISNPQESNNNNTNTNINNNKKWNQMNSIFHHNNMQSTSNFRNTNINPSNNSIANSIVNDNASVLSSTASPNNKSQISTVSNNTLLQKTNITPIKNQNFKPNSNLNPVNNANSWAEKTLVHIDQTGHKLINKPILNLHLQVGMYFFIFVSLMLAVIQWLFSYHYIDTMDALLTTEIYLFSKLNIWNQLLMGYELSILKNGKIMYNYNSSTFGNNCKETEYILSQFEHDTMKELIDCYPSVDKEYRQITNNNINKNLKEWRTFQESLNDENFCAVFSNYLSSIKDNEFAIFNLLFIQEENYDELYNKCWSIGHGLNSKGVNGALDSMYTSVYSLYQDFLHGYPFTEVENYAALNSEILYTLQVETDFILQRLPVCYYSILTKDFLNIKDETWWNEYLCFIALFLVWFVVVIYYILSIRKYDSEKDKLEFFENNLLNTIIF